MDGKNLATLSFRLGQDGRENFSLQVQTRCMIRRSIDADFSNVLCLRNQLPDVIDLLIPGCHKFRMQADRDLNALPSFCQPYVAQKCLGRRSDCEHRSFAFVGLCDDPPRTSLLPNGRTDREGQDIG
jgi:hypothetical protein